MTTDDPYPHLADKAKGQVNLSDSERIRIIKSGSFVKLDRSIDVLNQMQEFVDHPKVARMPGMLLVGPAFSGKTTILKELCALYPPDYLPESEITNYPVLMIEAPPRPDVTDFYCRILDKFAAVYKPNASSPALRSQVERLMRTLGVKVLVIDEIQHVIAGSDAKVRLFRNTLKSMMNELQICMVLSGTMEAYAAIMHDDQMASRFAPRELKAINHKDKQMVVLVKTMELRMPLKLPSNLGSKEMLRKIDQLAEGSIGHICELVQALAVEAIKSKQEQITLKAIADLKFMPLSKRTRQARPKPH